MLDRDPYVTAPNGSLAVMGDGLRPYQFDGIELTLKRGQPLPIGANRTAFGINFSLICRHATAVWLVLSKPCGRHDEAEIPLDPLRDRTGDLWHIQIAGLPNDFCYGYRVDGPSGNGHRYDPRIVLLDPMARSLSCSKHWGVSCGLQRRSLATTSRMFRHPEDISPRIRREDTVIYELHVRLFDRPVFGGGAPWHVQGAGRENPLLEEPGSDGDRAIADRRV